MNDYLIGMAALAIPIIFITTVLLKEHGRKKTKLALYMAYERLVRESKLSVEYADVLKIKVIALDRKNKKILLVDHRDNHRQELCIPLREIAGSRVVEVRDELEKCIKKVLLELTYKRVDKQITFCFYDERQDPLTELKTLTRKARQWKNRIDAHRLPGNTRLEMEYAL